MRRAVGRGTELNISGLARLIKSGKKARGQQRGEAYSRSEASVARQQIADEDAEWVSAMQAARGDKAVAKRMLSNRQMEDEDTSGLEGTLGIVGAGIIGSKVNELLGAPNRLIERGAMVMGDNYRGVAMSQMSEMGPFGKIGAKLVESMGKLTDAIREKSDALSPYSGELARETALAQVRQLRADIEESRRAGAAYAKHTEAQSRLQTELQAAFTPMKIELAKLMTDILNNLRIGVEVAKPVIDLIKDEIKSMRNDVSFIRGMIVGFIGEDSFGALIEEIEKGHKWDREIEEAKGRRWWRQGIPDLPDEEFAPHAPPDEAGLGFEILF